VKVAHRVAAWLAEGRANPIERAGAAGWALRAMHDDEVPGWSCGLGWVALEDRVRTW